MNRLIYYKVNIYNNYMFKKFEYFLENFIFNSRWLLTPIYIVLVLNFNYYWSKDSSRIFI